MPITILKAAAGIAAAAVIPIGMGGSVQAPADGGLRVEAVAAAPTVKVAPGSMMYPPAGEFLRDGRPHGVAPARLSFAEPVEIMVFQVSSGEYTACVDAGGCRPADERSTVPDAMPVTGVSYLDASAYADWYSKATAEAWRLPTDEEWAFVAAERFVGELQGIVDDPKNPARRWISSYAAEAGGDNAPDPRPRTRGSFGANSNGIDDLSGNVWEWTSTCYVRASLAADGASVAGSVENCGVRVLEGRRHRAYMSNFVSDGKSGGCAVGTPPDNLGFRLVRDRAAPLRTILRYLGQS